MTDQKHSQPINSIIIGDKDVVGKMYNPEMIAQITSITGVQPSIHLTSKDQLIEDNLPEDVVFIYATWGMIELNKQTLDKLPKLKAVFYAAGTVKGFVSDEFWYRNIRLSHAAVANAIPVAEFALASIILGHKSAFFYNQRKVFDRAGPEITGNFKSKVGIVGYGIIARLLRNHLRSFEFNILIYDPFLSEKDAQKEDMSKASLEEIFSTCTAVTLHAPNLESTKEMIKAEHLSALPPYATFINTARGAIVDEKALIQTLSNRPDIQAIIDVTNPEPPLPNNPLLSLPNVFITPHIAGAMGNEWSRLVHYMITESQNLLNNNPLSYEVTQKKLATMA